MAKIHRTARAARAEGKRLFGEGNFFLRYVKGLKIGTGYKGYSYRAVRSKRTKRKK